MKGGRRGVRVHHGLEFGPEFEALLAHVTRARNFDFTAYKRAGLARRVAKRMQAVGAADHAAYLRHLEAHPDEVERLLDAILINVTAFFRDDLPWEYLREQLLPRVLAAKGPGDPIRVWSAGCATGEEAYTLAIVLAEALGAEQFRERVKIYATDVDEDALARARQGAYAERDVAGLAPELVERYFERQDGRLMFRRDLRRLLIFGRNDLLQDAPISRIDVLACRNTLMYFDAAAQARVLARFHFALSESGFLLLGRAETLLTHHALFTPVDLRRRVFTKVARGGARERLGVPAGEPALADAPPPAPPADDVVLREAALDASTVAQLVVDRAGRLAAANARARGLFQLGPNDVGRPLQDLEVSYRPFELRSLIDQAYGDGRAVTRAEVLWRAAAGVPRWFEITVAPLAPPSPAGVGFSAHVPDPVGVSVTFCDVTRQKQLQQQIDESQAELEAAYQELQSTNEELETTNEELHSTVEELETTNEELQSTNEELETMNEELQSTNEELQTINDELRVRSDELNEANAFLASVFASLRAGVAVLDRDLRVLVWNDEAENLWGLRADEVNGQPFGALDIGLPVTRLVPALRENLEGGGRGMEFTVPAVNRRGRHMQTRITAVPLAGRDAEPPRGVIVLMVAQPPADETSPDQASIDQPPANAALNAALNAAPPAADGDGAF